MPIDSASRDLDLVGFANLRDLGGLAAGPGRRTRCGVLLRGDLPVDPDPAQLAGLAASGVRIALDLRDDEEVAASPSPFAAAGWTVLRRPLFDGSAASIVDAGTTLDDLYERLLDDRGAVFAETARVVATADDGVLVHCTAGKDRTGLAVALVLSAVGVGDDAVVADYAHSQDRLAGPWLHRQLADLAAHHGRDLSDRTELLVGSPPQVIAGALAHVAAGWGSAAGYLRAHGLSPAELAALTDRLTVAEPA